jgi:hypothetical protein
MLFVRIIMNFEILAEYKFHTENTLNYLINAFYRIDKLKNLFRIIRTFADDTEKYFNISKFHILTHYTEFIKKFRIFTDFNTSVGEAAYKILLKVYYDHINK